LIEKAKVEIQYLSPGALKKAQDRALQLFVADSKLFLAADKANKEAEVSAKELGQAFLKVRSGCKHGEFKKWFKRFRSSANRVNYCMRVAQGKVGKPSKPNPLRDATENFAHELKHLYGFARNGQKNEGEKQMVWMYQDLLAFWKDNYAEPLDVENYREEVAAKVYDLRLKKKRCTNVDAKKEIEREIKKMKVALAEAEHRADPATSVWNVDDPPPDAIAAAAAAAGAFAK
jgi:hypothetical protein